MARSPSTAGTAAPNHTPETTPVMLIGGDDDFGIQQRARQLWESWRKAAGGMDHELIDGSASNAGEALAALGRLREAIQTLPFFGGPKLVWFQNCTFLGEDRTSGSAAVTEALAELAEELKAFRWEGVRLLISASKPDRRRTLFKTLEKLGLVELFTALSSDDKDWGSKAETEAVRTFRAAGRSISDEALGELVTRTGPNLRLLAQECEKLILYTSGRTEVTRTDIEAVTARQKTAQAFALAEALGNRDLGKLLRTLDEELWEIRTGTDKKKSEIGLLYGLISKIRNLILVRELMQAGYLKPAAQYNAFKSQLDRIPPDDMPTDKRYNPLVIHPFVLFQAQLQAQNYASDELVRGMGLLLEANRKLVSTDADEARVLQQVLVEIVGAGAARRSPQRR
jgi:DNA polymerase-3 subunit delta